MSVDTPFCKLHTARVRRTSQGRVAVTPPMMAVYPWITAAVQG